MLFHTRMVPMLAPDGNYAIMAIMGAAIGSDAWIAAHTAERIHAAEPVISALTRTSPRCCCATAR